MSHDAALLSFRLGGTDGVSVEASKWAHTLEALDFSVRRVAGTMQGPPIADDVELPWLALGSTATVEPTALERALASADLVVVENVCSLPLNVDAARATAHVLERYGGRVVFHHHDLPWQRPNIDADEFPPRLPGALHVTINDRSRRELGDRGIAATTIRNAFDFDAPPGDRESTRATMAFEHDELVVLQPTRAIPRKNVGAGMQFAKELASILTERLVRFWLTGPAEDGFDVELARLLADPGIPVTTGRSRCQADAYAAADLVAFPSTWEGFGNPVIESIVARRPLAVSGYPVLEEITAIGLRCFSIDDPSSMAAWLRAPDLAILEDNRRIARSHYDLADLPGRLDAAFSSHGWTTW